MTVHTKFIWSDKEYCRLRREKRRLSGGNHRKMKEGKYRSFMLRKQVHEKFLEVGDIIQTCKDYFNHKIEVIGPDRIEHSNGYCCSWYNCCGLAYSVKEIEQYHLNHCQDVLFGNRSKEEHFAWYGNTDEGIDKWNKTVAWYQMLYDRLTAGQPICDENGLVLPECEYKR